jgi:hypothetical protein
VSDQKITLREMCASGVRGLLIDCSDYKCAHSVEISADRWGIMFACPTLNRCSPVRLAARRAPMSDRILIETRSGCTQMTMKEAAN